MTNLMETAIEDALKGISFAWKDGGRNYVGVPVQYPSGALCTLEVNVGLHEIHISDMGAGQREAWSLCEDTSYGRFANAEARKRGLIYDNGALMVRGVARGMLPAAIVAIANGSACAAHAAVRNDSERREEAQNDAVYEKVRQAFPTANVHRRLELSGGRATWGVHNVALLPNDRKAIFEPVSQHVGSVSAKFIMFSDLASREELVLNAVFSNPRGLDAKAQMLSEVANIIGVDDAIDKYRQHVH